MREIHLERERFRKPIVDGANALAFQPEIFPRPNLRVLNPSVELLEPTQIQGYISRRRIMEGTQPKERFIEREIDPDKPWSAFGQVMFVREHIVDGRSIKKIAAISIAYPGGVGTRMAGEILGKTLGIEQSKFEHWEGIKEGEIIATSKEVPDVLEQLTLMNQFVGNSGVVIANRHAQVEHEVVQHFFDLQEAREDFLNTVKEDAIAILTNPEFTGRSAFDDRYKDKGIYLIEGIIEDGVWDGGDPKGKRMHLLDMAVDESHQFWLEWAGKTAAAMQGDGIIVDADDTETVSDCGGCAAFFEKMEGDIPDQNTLKGSEYAVASGMAGSIRASKKQRGTTYTSGSEGSSYRGTCSTCGGYKNNKNGCKCANS